MLEKNSAPVLTESDIEAYNRGEVSDRIKDIWGLTFEQLRDIMETHNYKNAE